ncbi:hypothetical protein B0H63DRAFT_499391 [Podospora didyma]|uniref:DUF7053 domain-containing protein n=1 Tax=Podospora didyma TaxID=330526 RepID=A0AAE0NWR4_9PEZI|nr:hypothetical protein B0H63DRAFT_499391 [Podospora didyma]
MMRKKDTFTLITPIPGFIPRQLAIDILHSHSEVITLNPLVLEHKPIAAPNNAETDEYYSTWYEITERVTFIPGIGKMGASIIKFNGCFHDMPWGLQTHIYAPMNVDLRNTYRIAGNQPGFEAPEVPEIGLKALGAPADGLYLREDIEIKCNVTVIGFVKSQLKKAGGEMVQRIIKKAELLDAGVLQAMISDGKLKTVNPADRRNTIKSPLPSPMSLHYSPSISGTPPPNHPLNSPQIPYQIPRPQSVNHGQQHYSRPSTASSQHQSGYNPYPAPFGHGTPNAPVEMPASEPQHQPYQQQYQQHHQQQFSQQQQQQYAQQQQQAPNNRESTMSNTSQPSQFQVSPDPNTGKWSPPGSRPVSTVSSVGGMQSPGLDSKFSSSLAPHQETHEEHRDGTLNKLDPRNQQNPHTPYNPADYAKVGPAQPQYGRGQLSQRYNYTQ